MRLAGVLPIIFGPEFPHANVTNMIGIIDYGMGNLRSVQKAFQAVGADAMLMDRPGDPSRLSHLVLPGVGAFADGMAQLTARGWVSPIKSWIAQDRPFLGVCLGMQLLFAGSEEDAASPAELVPGLAVLPGCVRRFRAAPGERLKVPHMGWNAVATRRDDPLFSGVAPNSQVYFVHSYFCEPADGSLVSGSTDYPAGRAFCSTLWRGRLWATQFHPEKSQRVGLAMLANFAAVTERGQ